MSENVAIKEGARAYNFTVDKIRTAQQDSTEPVIWVPESTVRLGSLRASENGVYLARSEDLYGFNEIVVSVNGAATIGDRAVFPDDSGQLHEENLPHDIVIFRPPKKLKYEDGEKINLGGIVVVAMDADANVWTNSRYPNGVIPLRELIIDPDHADIESAETIYVGGGINALKLNVNIPMYSVPTIDYRGRPIGIYSTGYPCSYCSTHGPGVLLLTKYDGLFYAAYIEGSNDVDLAAYDPTYAHGDGWHLVGGTTARAGYHRFNYSAFGEYMTDIPTSETNPYHKSTDDLVAKEGVQSITVTWPRYGDNKALTTTFEINVVSGFSGGSGKF